METNLIKSVKRASKFWWISLVLGIIGIVLGVIAILSPLETLFALTIVFVISFFISGFTQIFYSISSKDVNNGWGWTLASGIIDILLGILLLSIPGGNITIFLLYIGFTALFQSLMGLGLAIQLQSSKVEGAGLSIALAVLGTIFSFLLIANLAFTAVFITAIMSITFFTYGIFRIVYALKIRSVGETIEKIIDNKQ